MKKILIVCGFFFVGAIAPVNAELPKKVRKNFPDIVKEYCHSRVTYSLDKPVGVWEDGWQGQAKIFHETVGCIFDSALQEVTEHEKKVAEKTFDASLPSIATFKMGGECQPKFLAIVQLEQQANGFVSECAKSDVPEISQIFSACRVAETVLQEWCAYDLFLYAKMQDEESFRRQKGDLGITSGEQNLQQFEIAKKKMGEERVFAELAVMDSLTWYRETEYASRQSAWMVALREELRNIQGEWAKLRSALGTFVDKFLNASVSA